MYRPHEAREDMVLFPAFRKLVSPQGYGAPGDACEARERQIFGADDLYRSVVTVAPWVRLTHRRSRRLARQIHGGLVLSCP